MLQVINKNNFENTLKDNEVVLVDFFADWCGPCKALHPSLEALSEKFEGKAKIVKVNVDHDRELSAQFGVRSIPALFYFKNGELAGKQMGLQPQSTIAQNIDQLLAS